MSENNLSNSVIMPREDFIELSEAAFSQPPKSTGDRVASTVQTSIVLAGIAACVTACSWGWAKAVTYREKKQQEHEIAKLQFELDNGLKP